MSNVLVRNLDERLVGRLKADAKRHGRSLQGEIKAILTEAVSYAVTKAAAVSGQWQERLKGRKLTDSAAMVREDRNR